MVAAVDNVVVDIVAAADIEQASLRPFVFSADGSGRTEATGDGEDIMVGHCAIGLEQLCKVAMVSTGGISGSTDVTRILVNQGRPMCNIEATTLQVGKK